MYLEVFMKKLYLFLILLLLISTSTITNAAEHKSCTERKSLGWVTDLVTCWWVTIYVDGFISNDDIRISTYNPDEMTTSEIASFYCKNASVQIIERFGAGAWRGFFLGQGSQSYLQGFYWESNLNGAIFKCLCPSWQSVANDKSCYPNDEVKYINDPSLKEAERIRTLSWVNQNSLTISNDWLDESLKEYQLKLVKAQLAEIEIKKTQEQDAYYLLKAKEDTERLQKQIEADKKKWGTQVIINKKKIKAEQNKKRLQEIRDKAKLKKQVKKVITRK